MTQKSSPDLEQFKKLVLDNKTRSEIMKEMNLKPHQFSALEMKLIKTDKKFYEIKSDRAKSSVKEEIVIGKRGNIVIPTSLVSGKFKEGDKFDVSIGRKKIILTHKSE